MLLVRVTYFCNNLIINVCSENGTSFEHLESLFNIFELIMNSENA